MLQYDQQSEINVRENGRRSPEWTIQRNWQNLARNTRNEGKINPQENTTQKTKKISNTDPTKQLA